MVVFSVPGAPPIILFVTVIRFSFVVDGACLAIVPVVEMVVEVVVGINSGNLKSKVKGNQ